MPVPLQEMPAPQPVNRRFIAAGIGLSGENRAQPFVNQAFHLDDFQAVLGEAFCGVGPAALTSSARQSFNETASAAQRASPPPSSRRAADFVQPKRAGQSAFCS